MFLIVFTCILVSRLLESLLWLARLQKKNRYVQSPWQPKSTFNFSIPLLQIKDILSFPGHSEEGFQWRQLSLYMTLFLRKQSCLFDAPPLILDRTILLELQFLDHQTSKTEKVKVHPGSRLVYNYKFLTGLYVGVMLHVFVCLVMTMTHSPSTAFM